MLNIFYIGNYFATVLTMHDSPRGFHPLSGDRVNAYVRLAILASTTAKMRLLIPRDKHPFQFTVLEHNDAINKFSMSVRLQPNGRISVNPERRDFCSVMSLYQHDSTKLWLNDVSKCSST